MSDSVWSYGLQPARLLCPWDSLRESTRVCCLALFQGIFPTQGLNLGLLHCRRILYCSATREAPNQHSYYLMHHHCTLDLHTETLWFAHSVLGKSAESWNTLDTVLNITGGLTLGLWLTCNSSPPSSTSGSTAFMDGKPQESLASSCL